MAWCSTLTANLRSLDDASYVCFSFFRRTAASSRPFFMSSMLFSISATSFPSVSICPLWYPMDADSSLSLSSSPTFSLSLASNSPLQYCRFSASSTCCFSIILMRPSMTSRVESPPRPPDRCRSAAAEAALSPAPTLRLRWRPAARTCSRTGAACTPAGRRWGLVEPATCANKAAGESVAEGVGEGAGEGAGAPEGTPPWMVAIASFSAASSCTRSAWRTFHEARFAAQRSSVALISAVSSSTFCLASSRLCLISTKSMRFWVNMFFFSVCSSLSAASSVFLMDMKLSCMLFLFASSASNCCLVFINLSCKPFMTPRMKLDSPGSAI
mmetsp:Transcript_22940/g.66351  ORF Transcript_22940/g.66351 Transcript_22940/m.66351 type:complete len:327 (-) Transcript_22940:719-1699(-)